jgi:hypothetical protein
MEGSTFYNMWHLHISPQPPKHKVHLVSVKKEMIKSFIEPSIGETQEDAMKSFKIWH